MKSRIVQPGRYVAGISICRVHYAVEKEVPWSSERSHWQERNIVNLVFVSVVFKDYGPKICFNLNLAPKLNLLGKFKSRIKLLELLQSIKCQTD